MYKVVVSSLFLNGTKHVRGDMLDVPDDVAQAFGTNVEFVADKPKPKRAPRKKKAVKSED